MSQSQMTHPLQTADSARPYAIIKVMRLPQRELPLMLTRAYGME